jgi:drug/metabolite transporter (DMT)-like permease
LVAFTSTGIADAREARWARLLLLAAERRANAAVADAVGCFVPAVAVVLAGALLGERLAPLQLLGTLGILGGVVLLAWPASATDARSSAHSIPAAMSGMISWWRHRLAVRPS